jgi:tRNA1(Val) A37 N6-methylase TrmN6
MNDQADLVATTNDSFLGGRVFLRQPRQGHRAGTDAVLLAAAVPAEFKGLVLDVGAGVGAAGLAVATLRPHVTLGLVEIDPAFAAFARDNLSKNAQGRGSVYVADICDAKSRREAGLFDGCAQAVITNPPFFDPARGRHSPDVRKRAAHVMSQPGNEALEAWIAACVSLLADGGVFVMIHRPEALPAILSSCLAACAGLGEVSILPVHPRATKPASRILVRGKKGSRAPLSFAPPLILHEGEKFTAQAEALHRGEALIDWAL